MGGVKLHHEAIILNLLLFNPNLNSSYELIKRDANGNSEWKNLKRILLVLGVAGSSRFFGDQLILRICIKKLRLSSKFKKRLKYHKKDFEVKIA